jgi:transcription initiation factor TFIIE subunit alpha
MLQKIKKLNKAFKKTGNKTSRKSAAKSKKVKSIGVKKTNVVKKAAPEQRVEETKKGGKKIRMNHLWDEVLLKDPKVRKWLVQAVGENAIKVLREFETELSDEEISKRSGIRASDVRVVLNRLHSYGLATYLRKRDKNSGWYSYIWKLDDKHTQELVNGVNEIKDIEEEMAVNDEKEYYYCPNEKPIVRILFEDAVVNNFRCSRCNGMMEFFDPKKAKEAKKQDA